MFHRKFTYYFLVLTMVLSFVSCRKWVDEKPSLQIDQNEIFSNDQGFREVLNGVYLQMGSRSLYGRDLTTGLLSLLGRSYDTTIAPSIGNLFYQGAKFNLQDADVVNTSKSIWDSAYFCIGNLNNLLANVESRKN